MAVWVHQDAAGIPRDLTRALRAVCEIGHTTREVSQSLTLPGALRIGAGVNTGPAILGGTDYTALGDTVNAAFRLEAATKTMGFNIALGEGAIRALGENLNSPFKPCCVELKGYEAPTTAWGISFQELQRYLESHEERRGAPTL
jgi:adenylate cyclase